MTKKQKMVELLEEQLDTQYAYVLQCKEDKTYIEHPSAIYYKGMLSVVETIGDWKRNEDGKHSVFIW